MAPKFSKYEEVIYEGADGKYKGKVKEAHEKSGRFGSYHEYDVQLTHKEGLATTVTSVTTSSKTQGWEDIKPYTKEKVSEGSLSKV